VEMEAELSEMVGRKTYRRLRAYLQDRDERIDRRTPLPHPVLRSAAHNGEVQPETQPA
jgi:hypothetical protein